MKIDRVAFTGADESVTPEQVLAVVEEYPDIKTEWALLLSKSNEGKRTRYPSLAWMENFVSTVNSSFKQINLAGHLQGYWLRTMVAGKPEFPIDRPTLWPYFQRIQLNFHGIQTVVTHDGFFTELRGSKQFIFQMDGVNENIYDAAQELGITNLVPLFDLSAGAGIVPDIWPKVVHPLLNGYAGGLGPETIREQLKRLEQVVGDSTIWIDMESRIRSDDDRRFDLSKCRRVLDIVAER